MDGERAMENLLNLEQGVKLSAGDPGKTLILLRCLASCKTESIHNHS